MSRCRYQLLAAVVGREELPGLEGLGPSNIMHANQPVQQGTVVTKSNTGYSSNEKGNEQGSYSSVLVH